METNSDELAFFSDYKNKPMPVSLIEKILRGETSIPIRV